MLSIVKCFSRENNCNGSPGWINGKEHHSSAFGIILCGDYHKATGLVTTFRCSRHPVSMHAQPYGMSRKTVQNPVNLFSRLGWTVTLWAVASTILNADTLHICMKIAHMHGMNHDFVHACCMSSALWWSSLQPGVGPDATVNRCRSHWPEVYLYGHGRKHTGNSARLWTRSRSCWYF